MPPDTASRLYMNSTHTNTVDLLVREGLDKVCISATDWVFWRTTSFILRMELWKTRGYATEENTHPQRHHDNSPHTKRVHAKSWYRLGTPKYQMAHSASTQTICWENHCTPLYDRGIKSPIFWFNSGHHGPQGKTCPFPLAPDELLVFATALYVCSMHHRL